MTDRPPASGEPSTEAHPRRRLNRLHALRTKWGDCYWKPGDRVSAPEWAADPCEALEPDLIEFENDVRADFTALIRAAGARASPPALDVERLRQALPNNIWDYDGYDGNPDQLAEEIAAEYARLTRERNGQ